MIPGPHMPLLVLALFASLLAGCRSSAHFEPVTAAGPIERPEEFDHSAFDRLLAAHVAEDGLVDYRGLTGQKEALDAYLSTLAATDPVNLSPDDRLAFLINTYNAYTLKLIVDNYPVSSVLRVVGGPFIPTVNSPFSVRFVTMGGETYTLDNIEHDMIRRDFDEPRIHYAVVCAAISCPPLRAEAYVGSRLEEQLDDQARRFLHDPDKNLVPDEDGVVRLSKILDWYSGDFSPSIQQSIAPYFEGDVRERLERQEYTVRYLSYDWSLNEQPLP
jgi:hypothetical protein